jgi:hypothetical protein
MHAKQFSPNLLPIRCRDNPEVSNPRSSPEEQRLERERFAVLAQAFERAKAEIIEPAHAAVAAMGDLVKNIK